MDLFIRNAKQSDYESLLPLFRQVHEFHVFIRPDLYKENSTPIEQGFFESQLLDGKQHIFVATTGNDIVGVVVAKEEEVTENTFVKARKSIIYKRVYALLNTEKERYWKKTD